MAMPMAYLMIGATKVRGDQKASIPAAMNSMPATPITSGIASAAAGMPDAQYVPAINAGGTGLSIPAFGVVLDAFAKDGDSNVLATPHILATDNIPAEISIGQNIPLQTNVQGIGSLLGGAGAASGAAGALSALGGLVILLGPGRVLVGLIPHPDRHARHLFELFLGVALLPLAGVLWLGRARVARRIAKGVEFG